MTSHFFSSRFFNLCGAPQLLFLSMPRPKLFFLFSSQFLTLCGASQLLFSLHAPSEALLSLFFSFFHSLRGISASFPSPCPVRSSSFPFLLVFSTPAGHLSFFSFPIPRLKHCLSDYKTAMPAGSAHTQPTSKNSYLLHRPQSPSHWLSGDSLP